MPSTVRLRWDGEPGAPGERGRSFFYDSFIPDPINALDFAIPLSAAAEIAEAERAVRDLTGVPALEGVEAVSRQLLRAESVASSRIEGLQLSHRRLAKAVFDPAAADRTARAVVGNIEAMEAAIRIGSAAEAITIDDVLDLHARLFAGTPDAPGAGQVRTRQNWIGGTSINPGRAEFVPPPPDRVLPLLEDLCSWMNREDVPPVAQAAVSHAQFETIHPFPDGNGRVGRALIHVILRRRGTAPIVVPPVSLVLLGNADAYVDGLTAYREGDVAAWMTRFARMLGQSAALAVELAESLGALQAEWTMRAGRPRAGSAAARLIAVLPSRPVLDINTVAAQLSVSYPQARQAVLRLEDAGVLRQTSIGRRRNRAWEAPSLLDLLDAFEFEALGPTNTDQVRRPSPRRRE